MTLKMLFMLLALIGLVATCIMLVAGEDTRALVSAVLTTGLFVAAD